MTDEIKQEDAIVHKYEKIPVQRFGEGIDFRRIAMNVLSQPGLK